MKNVFFILVLLCAGFSVTSCTPESILDDVAEPLACCDQEEPILPPPPPPPPVGSDNN